MKSNADKSISWIVFGILLVLSFTTASLFLYNIHRWSVEPDFGFFHRSATGLHVVAGVNVHGRRAGLRPGDRILTVNGKHFTTRNQLRACRNYTIGESNTYRVDRMGESFDVTVENVPFGFSKAFRHSGFTFLVGLSYFLISVLVFLMKPHHRSSWAFYLFGTCFGLLLMFLFKGSTWTPSWMGTLHVFLYTMSPAAFIHMALNVPNRWKSVDQFPFLEWTPYGVSLILFVCIRLTASETADIPREWFIVLGVYFVGAVLSFLVSSLLSWLRSTSEIVKVRAKCILSGIFIAISIPLLDFVLDAFFRTHIVPGFNYYLPFLLFFPLCIAYSIVKHNLFDIQTTVRKTFGYILATISVLFLYTMLVIIPLVVFGKRGVSEYPGLTVASIVVIIFLFNFFRQRVQRLVDRVFYRMEYDYKNIMEKIGQSMRSSLMLDQIVTRMMDIVLNSLFIETGYVMLKTKDGKSFVSVLHKEPIVMLPAEDPFLRILSEKKKGITRYDITEDPALQENREAYERIFEQLEATLIIPILFEGRLFGLLVLGEKKSGKFYQREDILLLNFLADQAALAMENTRLQQSRLEALEQSKKELEALNIAKTKALDLLSHELKTPLSVISGSMKRLEREAGETGDRHKREKIFRRVETHLSRLYEIQESTDKIIRSHKEAEQRFHSYEGKKDIPAPRESIALHPFARRMLAVTKERAAHREIAYELEGPEDLGVTAHPAALEDAAASLLRNAVENTPDEGLVRILLEKSDNETVFKIKDFGIGIADKNRKHLFEAFYHTQETDRYATRNPYDFDAGGRGLSLFRIRSYAEQFGFGFFMNSKRCRFLPDDLDSCPGRISLCPHCKMREDCLASGGSTFWLAFPAFQ